MSVAVPGSETILLGAQSTRENIAGEEMSSREAGPAACEREGELVNDCLPAESYTHAIGSIAFGDDGSLFVGNGEGARANALDPRALRAQNIDSLGGKILRINPLNGNGYPDNPFYDGDPTHDRSKVWSYGLRNPYTFALHPSIQEVFIGDVGWKTWEEINIGSRGKNFGWPCYEGDRTHSAIQTSYQSSAETQRQCAVVYALGPDAVQDPLYAYHHSKIGAAIVVGSFYQGHAYPSQYQGALFFTDFVEDWIRYLVFDPSTGQARTQDFAVHVSPEGNLTRIKSGPDGDLYYLVYNGEASEVRRIHYDANRTPL
jgi:glucose/arabinose dehydrogenase